MKTSLLKHMIAGALSGLLFFGSLGIAEAVVIKPNSATASSEFSGSFTAINTINGTGLTDPSDPNEAHADYAQGNHWTTASGTSPLDASITWGFNVPTELGGIYIWNHRSNIISANPNYEPTLFDLELFDASSASLLVLNNVSLAPDTAIAQAFSFGALFNVSSIRFDVLQTQGSSTFTGLAEVAFNTEVLPSAVPIPAALPLYGTGLAVMGFIGWRRKRKLA